MQKRTVRERPGLDDMTQVCTSAWGHVAWMIYVAEPYPQHVFTGSV